MCVHVDSPVPVTQLDTLRLEPQVIVQLTVWHRSIDERLQGGWQQAHHLISFHLRGRDHFGLEQLAISYSRPKSALFYITLNNVVPLMSSGVPLGDQEYEYSNSLHHWPSDNFEGRSSTKQPKV